MLNHSVINKKQGVQILLSREKKDCTKKAMDSTLVNPSHRLMDCEI